MRAILLGLALSGCNFDTIPGQYDATVLVWDQRYGALNNISPPNVEWLWGKSLNCDKDPHTGLNYAFYAGDFYGDIEHGKDCVGGKSWETGNISQIALFPGAIISKTSFSHELWHMYLLATKNNIDTNHKDPGFGIQYGFPKGIVDLANEDLELAGL